MHCPVCNYKSSRVVDSRLTTDGSNVRRRRECERPKCGYRFSTSEEVELLDVAVVKRDGRREAYSRAKLMNGLKKALEKRPYTEAQFQSLIHKIEREMQKKRSGEITSKDLGEMVMKQLLNFDKVAYIRFASIYHSFDDLASFEAELRKLIPKKGKRTKG
jgi:transcriptional repressor NrdR